jgi:hypothetical protein
MRALPAAMVCVCGLADGSFPRRDRRASFDLLATERRRLDRNTRSDDRQLFLDVLLAARRRLLLTVRPLLLRGLLRRAVVVPAASDPESSHVIERTWSRRVTCGTRRSGTGWMPLGSFAGTKGRALAIASLGLALSGAGAAAWSFDVEALFQDGRSNQQMRHARGATLVVTGANGRQALVGLRISIVRARGVRPPAPAGGQRYLG